MDRRIAPAIVFLTLLVPAASFAQARVLQFRSAEDAASPPEPAVCAHLPWTPGPGEPPLPGVEAMIGGSLYTYETQESTGEVVTRGGRRIGKATACVHITSFAFPPRRAENFLLQLTLPDGVYTALGTCTIISNDMPVNRLVLGRCNLEITAAPAGVIGGAVTSLTTFNPFRLPGFATGSYWTAQIYELGHGPEDHEDSDHAMEWIDGGDHDPGK